MQLYEASLLLGCLMIGKSVHKGLQVEPGRGTLALTSVAAYCATRFVTDFFRAAETSPPVLAGVPLTQAVSLAGFVICATVLWAVPDRRSTLQDSVG